MSLSKFQEVFGPPSQEDRTLEEHRADQFFEEGIRRIESINASIKEEVAKERIKRGLSYNRTIVKCTRSQLDP